jgi:acyl-CoA synthetase (AMP-forming)/AMP-acid ligase II
VDEDGFLYLVDRKKDMIDTGGMKVYPKDVEEIAAHHPAIREVAVFGIPHDKWGETPVAAVVLREKGCAGEDELRDWINARVAAKYQRVDRVLVLDEFPRNTAGKTLKRELRAPFWEGRAKEDLTTWHREHRLRCHPEHSEGSAVTGPRPESRAP